MRQLSKKVNQQSSKKMCNWLFKNSLLNLVQENNEKLIFVKQRMSEFLHVGKQEYERHIGTPAFWLQRYLLISISDHSLLSYLFKKNLHILCSPSRAYYQTDFDDFRLKMTVEEWSKIHASKMRDFQSASLRKCNFSFHFRLQIAPATAFRSQTFLWQYYCK